jgi:heme exporter protein C
MRDKIMIALAGLAALIIVWVLHTILWQVPDEKNQGAIFRIIYFHVPSAMTAAACALAAFVASVLYLVKRNLSYDAIAVAVTEGALLFGAVVLVTGMIWARIIWGIWWTWDARLTSMLVSWLMYAGYLMLRRAVEEPTERARNSAVLSIFIFPGVYITWKSIEWWRTQHPGPVLSIRQGGGMAPGMESPIYVNLLALLCLAAVLVMLRYNQELRRRELDSLRRTAHAMI